jgi:hypothetical protein
MSEHTELAREVDVFCRYLCGAPAGEYVLAQYLGAHAAGVVELPSTTSFDRALVRMARASPALTRALDAYARVFANGGLLRRKLVLLLAILETKSPTAEQLDAPTEGSRAGMLARMAWLGVVFAVLVVATALALVPVRVACALRGTK